MVYEATREFPKEELFGLVFQMRCAAVGIGSNIAEGAAGQSRKAYIALGSTSELDTQLEIAKATGMTDRQQLETLQSENERAKRMLYGLIRSIKQ